MNKPDPTFNNWPVKPMMIVPPDTMSEDDLKRLRENNICVVVSKDPSAVKFLDPIPAAASRTKIEDAAIQLSRRLLRGELFTSQPETKRCIAALYVELLVQGTPLQQTATPQEVEKEVFDNAKHDEICRIAREEAKEEQAAKKAARLKLPSKS